ncbi:MAG: glycosyltransferase family 39 protein [Bacteroidales bacterium]|nr:glycosyltransferase family 39 protein [Bacteroidales bacterium]MDD4217481.1 glycosyltransferase family 39 protein [Bacteroidales bacterium]MDY0143022.1 glycosyltransferase family 39 protein [Bacteroidales bacterium]
MEMFDDNNIIFIIALSIGFIAISISAFLHFKCKYKISLFILILGGLLLRLTISSDAYLHPHDEKYHALVAKNMVTHPFTPTLYEKPVHEVDYRNWAANHIWLHKQPVPLWTMALSISIFGTNEFAVRLPSILLSSLGIWVLYQISLFFFNSKNQRTIAWLSAFLFAINGLILELTGGRIATDHYDVFFMIFILIAIYFTIKFVQTEKPIYNIITGFFIGLAVLTKWLPAFIVIALWLILIYDTQKFKFKTIVLNLILLFSVTLIVFLPWQIYIFTAFPTEAAYTSSFNLRHLTEVLDEQTGAIYYYLLRMGTNYGELIYLPLVFLMVYILKNYRDYKKLSLAVWIFIPLIFFSVAKTKMQAYILFIAPALFMITAWFWSSIKDVKMKGFNKYIKYLVLGLVIILPLRYSIERIKPFSDIDRKPIWVSNLKSIDKTGIPEKSVLFNFPYPIEAMFYTDFTAYSLLPSLIELEKFYADEYNVFIHLKDNVPPEILNNSKFKCIKIE